MDRLFYYATGVDLVSFCLDIALNEVKAYEYYRTGNMSPVVHVKFFNGPPGQLKVGTVSKIFLRESQQEIFGLIEHGLFSQAEENAKIVPLTNGGARFYYCIGVGDSEESVDRTNSDFYAKVDFIDSHGVSLKRS